MFLINSLQNLLARTGIFVSRTPLKFYYDLENEIKNNLIINSKGVLHIGAHYGQERHFYSEHGLNVIWIEAIPEVYAQLERNISGFDKQIAYCALVGNESIVGVDFFISNNNGSASSIFDISEDSKFKSVSMQKKIQISMTRLDNLLSNVDIANYSHWIIDVQGSELLVLQGAGNLLKFCQSITIEVSTRETYVNGAKYEELKTFLFAHGFIPLWEPTKNDHTDIPFIRSKIL
jgi:FkbM family methyltransferase